MKCVDYNQNQDRSVKRPVRPLKEENVTDAKDKAGDSNGAQRQQVNSLGQPTALPNREIAEEIGEGCTHEGCHERQLQRIQYICRQPDTAGVAEDIGDVFKSKAQIIRKRLCERQADKGQLWHEEQDAKDNDHNCRCAVKTFATWDQPVLPVTALILKDQVKHK